MLTESPDSDGDDKFQEKSDNSGRERNKKEIVAPSTPIFKKQTEKNN